MSIFSDEISEIHPELWAIDHPRPIYESAGLPGALEAIDALVGPQNPGLGPEAVSRSRFDSYPRSRARLELASSP